VPSETLLERLRRAAALPLELRRRLAVQLRDPELSASELLCLGKELRDLTRAAAMSLVVNDRLDLALVLAADGVHLGRRSVSVSEARRLLGPAAWISTSCHDLAQLGAVAAAGPNAVLLSPIFASPGKGEPLGLGALAEARAVLPPAIGLIALGGVTPKRVRACLDAGANGVAGIRADLMALPPGFALGPT